MPTFSVGYRAVAGQANNFGMMSPPSVLAGLVLVITGTVTVGSPDSAQRRMGQRRHQRDLLKAVMSDHASPRFRSDLEHFGDDSENLERSSAAKALATSLRDGAAARIRARADRAADLVRGPGHGKVVTSACSRHRRGIRFSQCANLSPAGTGTTTITDAFLRSQNPFTAHSHVRAISELARNAIRCFVITVRDPAARIHSGLTGPGEAMSHRFNITARALLRRLRNGTTPANWATAWRWHYGVGVYFRSQHENLEGLDCNEMELHVLCTCSMEGDWAALREKFGAQDWGSALPSLDGLHLNHRGGEKHNHGHATWSMTDADAAFARQTLYPDDWELYRTHCSC